VVVVIVVSLVVVAGSSVAGVVVGPPRFPSPFASIVRQIGHAASNFFSPTNFLKHEVHVACVHAPNTIQEDAFGFVARHIGQDSSLISSLVFGRCTGKLNAFKSPRSDGGTAN
jgi:hypothetical protein